MPAPASAQTPNAAVTGTSSTTNGLTLTPTCPTPSASSVMVLVVHNDAGDLSSVSIPTPSGWTAGPTKSTSTNDIITALFWRTGFTATSQAVTLNATGGQYYGWASLTEWSNVNTASPFNVTATLQTSETSAPVVISGAPVTPTITGGLVASFWGFNQPETAGNETAQSGWTQIVYSGTDGSNYAAGYVSYDNTLSTNGTLVTPSLNISGIGFSGVVFECLTVCFSPSSSSIALPPNYDGGMARYAGGMAA
jgi:hypothetical protein